MECKAVLTFQFEDLLVTNYLFLKDVGSEFEMALASKHGYNRVLLMPPNLVVRKT